MTIVSEDEAEPIHSAIIRHEAWTVDPVRHLRADADRHMKEGLWTVTAERPQGVELEAHDYYSEAPYWWPNPGNPAGPYVHRHGEINPDRFMANKNALNAMSESVFALGTAAYLLDEPRYAQRAARVVHAWFINPKTRMNPNLDHAQAVRGIDTGRSTGVLEGRIFIRAIQGMEFLEQTGVWDPRDQAAVRKWFEEYLHWLTESKNGIEEKYSGNNHAAWWTAQAAAIAAFLQDTASERMVFNYYRDRVFPRQVRSDGSAPREESHTRSLSYSAFNLEAYATTCRIAQVHGVDLWSIRARNGAALATVIDYLEPYLADPKKWNREQISDFQGEGLYSLAFAGMGMKRPEYIALYRKLERSESAWPSLIDLLVGRWEAAAHQTRH
jgi:hypothetical protein